MFGSSKVIFFFPIYLLNWILDEGSAGQFDDGIKIDIDIGK